MRPPHILLVSGWQTVNIGDIAHTFGMLALIEREIPGTRVTLWPYKPLGDAVLSRLAKRFPDVKVLAPTPLTADFDAPMTDPDLLAAFESADLCLHNSGPAMIGWRHCEAFARHTGRPFGIYGVTYGLYGIPERASLDRAAFAFFRDSHSLRAALADGVSPPAIGLALDAAFATDIRDDAAATKLLAQHNLTPGNFLCAIPKWRNTPTWEMPGYPATPDPTRLSANLESLDTLNRPILDAITAIIRTTSLNILLCPEDTTHVKLIADHVYPALPDDVKPRVACVNHFWLTDEALSVYLQSAGLFSADQHSPIMCTGHGVPAVLARWKEQSTKGYMWHDLKLNDWLFDFDQDAERPAFTAAAIALAQNLPHAKSKAQVAQSRVKSTQHLTMSLVKAAVESAHAARI